MNLPERIVGFVEYDNAEYPFEFDQEGFILNMFPPTTGIWKDNSSIEAFIPLFTSMGDKSHKWIEEKRIIGTTADHKRIVFCVKDIKCNYSGFYSYDVIWFYYNSQEICARIDGFKVTADEVNWFFTPMQSLQSKYTFTEDGTRIDRIAVTSNKQITESCGKYRVIPHVDADVEVTCYAKGHTNNFTNPIDASSELITTFSTPVDLDTVIKAYHYTRGFLQYITYRTNISIPSVSAFCFNEDGLREQVGILVFKNSVKKEEHQKKAQTIIDYSILRKRSSSILSLIKNNKLGFQHMCKSIDDTSHYSSSRVIMIFAQFEREFRNIYGVDNGRSQEYIDTKNDIVDLINDYVKTHSGKTREYAKQFKKYVNNRDSSFEFNLKRAMTDCLDIMEPFVKNRYRGSYKKAVNGICSRMGVVRNGIAHSRLDFTFRAVHMSDIKIVEELIYAIRLKSCGLSKTEVQKSINNIFRENFAI